MNVSQIKALADYEAQYSEAMAIGDRARAGGIFKKIRDVLGNADPEKLKGWLSLLLPLFGLPSLPLGGEADEAMPASTAQALGVSGALSVGEAQAAGITDNPQLWIQLITLILAFIKALRGEPTDPEATPSLGG